MNRIDTVILINRCKTQLFADRKFQCCQVEIHKKIEPFEIG